MPERVIAILAQLVEHITRNDEVVGSIPTNGSKNHCNPLENSGFFFEIFMPLLTGTVFGTVREAFVLLRRGKHYYCRVWVPLDLRERIGRKELKKSLLTTDKQAARLAEVQLLHKTELAFSRLRIAMLTDRELEQISVSILADFTGRIEEHRKGRKDPMSFLEAGRMPYGLDVNFDSGVLPLLEASFAFPRNVANAVEYYSGKITELIVLKNSGVYRDDFRRQTRKAIYERSLDVELPPDGWFNENAPEWLQQPPEDFSRVHDAILDGLIEGYTLELQRVKGVKNPAIEAAVTARIEAAKHRPKLSELWEAYKAYKNAKGKWGESSADGYERFYTETVKVVGDKELSDYSQDDAIKLLESLKKNRASTATGKVEFVSSLFRFALKTPDSCDRWKVRGNPFTEMQVKDDGGDKPERRGYSKEELYKLAEGLLSVRKLVEPHRFWVPLVALYTGARQNDVCQLRVADIKNIDGVLAFEFCHKPASQQSTKARKTRVCPVHPMLLKLGFGKYLQAQEAAGHDRLFHLMKYSKGKKWTGKIRTWWNTTFQGNILDDSTGVSFHSFRKSFINWFKQNGCYVAAFDRSVIQSMIGHDEDDDVTGVHYEEDYSPKEKLRMLSKLDYGFPKELIDELQRKEF